VADLIAEYLTDTILRIDNDAIVDLRVMVKQDLIVVTGQVGCSHPAKGAIIHSEQYLATLNGSLREFIREIGFSITPPNSKQTTTPITPPQGSLSPKKQVSVIAPTGVNLPPSPNAVNNILDDDDQIDPAHVHVILAITQSLDKDRSNGHSVTCRARASATQSDALRVARNTEQAITQYRRANGGVHVSGGIVVEVEASKTWIRSIVISFSSKSSSDRFLSDIAGNVLASEFLLSLSPKITTDTSVVLKNINRASAGGISSEYCGKDWGHPLRHAHVLACQEAQNLVQSAKTFECEVEMRVGAPISESLPVVVSGIHICSREPQSNDDNQLMQCVLERCSTRTAHDVKGLTFDDRFGSFLALNTGGSSCSIESFTRY
jgi:hypothetical protein